MQFRHIIYVIALMTSSCATPQEITRLIPEAPEGHFEVGREYIPLKNDSIEAELGFDGRSGDFLVFDFVVINNSDSPLSINPAEFYCVALEDPLADSSMLPPKMAMHPERVLNAYDRWLEAQEKRKKMNTALGFIDAGISILATASAFAATDNPAYIADAVLNTLGTADQYVAAGHLIGAEMNSLSKEREVVQNEIFRAQELPSGKVANGFVYFPAGDAEKYLMFCFPMEDRLFQYVYRQE